MKTVIMAMACIAFLSVSADAQKGTTQFNAGVEVAFPAGDFGNAFKTGFGINGKALFGITDVGQITATTGYAAFTAKGSTKDYKTKVSIIPLLAGYRHRFSQVGLYVEPQAGIAVYPVKSKYAGVKSTDSETNFTWALGGGYVYDKYDFSLRYQSGEATGGSIGLFALKVAYNFALPKK